MENEAVLVGDDLDVVEHQAAVHVHALLAEHVQHALGAEFAFLFAVGLQYRLQLGSFGERELVAELRDNLVHGGAAALAREAQGVVLVAADDGVVDGAVGTLLHVLRLGGAILVDAATVHNRFGANQRGAAVDVDAGPLRDENRRLVDAFHVQAGLYAGVVQRDRDFVKIRVAAAFAQAVQRYFQLGRAHEEAFDGGGSRHAQVVVAVHRDGDIFRQSLVHLLDLVHVQRGAVAFHRIRQVDGRRTGFNHGLQHVNHEIHVLEAVAEVLGAEFHVALVAHERLGKLHAMNRLLLDLFGGQVQHVLHRERACREERMDTRVRRKLHSLPATLDIAFHAAGQARDNHALCHLVAFFGHLRGQLRQFLARFKVHLGRSREADFGTLHAELQELQVNVLFLGVVPGLRERLVAVTQGDIVKERLSVRHIGTYIAHFSSPCRLPCAAKSFFLFKNSILP